MTEKELKQKAEAEADKVIIGSGMDRASVIHLKHLLVTMYMQGATENGIQWHYVEDELPPEDVPLLCIRGGKIYVAWYYNGIYHNDKRCQVKKPFAWKEIVLPELPKEE